MDMVSSSIKPQKQGQQLVNMENISSKPDVLASKMTKQQKIYTAVCRDLVTY